VVQNFASLRFLQGAGSADAHAVMSSIQETSVHVGRISLSPVDVPVEEQEDRRVRARSDGFLPSNESLVSLLVQKLPKSPKDACKVPSSFSILTCRGCPQGPQVLVLHFNVDTAVQRQEELALRRGGGIDCGCHVGPSRPRLRHRRGHAPHLRPLLCFHPPHHLRRLRDVSRALSRSCCHLLLACIRRHLSRRSPHNQRGCQSRVRSPRHHCNPPPSHQRLMCQAALLVGLFQVGLGLFRLGFIASFLSHPVIVGFTTASAIIIGHLSRINVSLPQACRKCPASWATLSKRPRKCT
jgi:hypothetical protein